MAREDWVNAALSLLDSGRLPSEVSVAEMCSLLGVAEESFYRHFRDVGEFRAAVAAHGSVTGLPCRGPRPVSSGTRSTGYG